MCASCQEPPSPTASTFVYQRRHQLDGVERIAAALRVEARGERVPVVRREHECGGDQCFHLAPRQRGKLEAPHAKGPAQGGERVRGRLVIGAEPCDDQDAASRPSRRGRQQSHDGVVGELEIIHEQDDRPILGHRGEDVRHRVLGREPFP